MLNPSPQVVSCTEVTAHPRLRAVETMESGICAASSDFAVSAAVGSARSAALPPMVKSTADGSGLFFPA